MNIYINEINELKFSNELMNNETISLKKQLEEKNSSNVNIDDKVIDKKVK